MKLNRFSSFLNESEATKKYTEEEVTKFFNIVKQQADLVKGGIEPSDALSTLGKLFTLEAETGMQQDTQSYAEWIVDQVLNNKLPDSSSGSLYTAIIDLDNLVIPLNAEDGDDEAYYNMINRVYRKIFR